MQIGMLADIDIACIQQDAQQQEAAGRLTLKARHEQGGHFGQQALITQRLSCSEGNKVTSTPFKFEGETLPPQGSRLWPHAEQDSESTPYPTRCILACTAL